MGLGDFREVVMSSLFSVAFTGIFLAFIIAAIVGHALLIQALVRPFFGRLAPAGRPAPAKSLLHAR
jgi:hypothetical protein